MLENLYSRAKLFLFPSLYDANSLVQIEAACQSTPTLFLEGARTAATVTPDVNGYVCPPDEDSYARMILDILADPEAYERVSAAARRDLYLNWDDVVRDVYNDYNALLWSLRNECVFLYFCRQTEIQRQTKLICHEKVFTTCLVNPGFCWFCQGTRPPINRQLVRIHLASQPSS